VNRPHPVRILVVDDEAGIRETLPVILRFHGYEVTAAATVPEALEKITSSEFDVLLADLNIGNPGDGFTVVSAMRRTHPECVTFILTGYPAFETALTAIRMQVDDYLIKPATPKSLIDAIEHRLHDRKRPTELASRRVSAMVRENICEIAELALSSMRDQWSLEQTQVDPEVLREHLIFMLGGIADMLDNPGSEANTGRLVEAGRLHGKERYDHGDTIPLLIAGIYQLQRTIYDVAQSHLLSLNLSYLMPDLMRLNEYLGAEMQEAVKAFLLEEHRRAA